MTPRPPCRPTGAPEQGERTRVMALVRSLVRSHRTGLVALARGEGLRAEDAFDVVQEAFQSFLTGADTAALADDPEAAGKVLAAVTRNLARNRRRLHAVARPHTSEPGVLDALPNGDATVEQ